MPFLLSTLRQPVSSWTRVVASGILVASVGCGGASKASPPPAPVPAAAPVAAAPAAAAAALEEPGIPTSPTGLFTLAQASRGKDVYAGTCKSCHTPADQIGSSFNQLWRNRPLSALYTYVSTKMPQDNPGSLAPNDVADVVSYLLFINKMPVGPTELPPDADSLAHIVVGKPNF
ncbi:MAG TPA: cytochrome c [Gemmatimonadaceae bacterium]|jgi:mono/diheme cytochrome c family protein